MADEIEILSVNPNPQGYGEAVTMNIRYGAKEATLVLRPAEFLVEMTEESWREELRKLASALQTHPIKDRRA